MIYQFLLLVQSSGIKKTLLFAHCQRLFVQSFEIQKLPQVILNLYGDWFKAMKVHELTIFGGRTIHEPSILGVPRAPDGTMVFTHHMLELGRHRERRGDEVWLVFSERFGAGPGWCALGLTYC